MSGAALSGRRATREEINHLLTELGNLGFYDICEEYEVCGSYRRGKHESGDIDIVFLPKSKEVYENWFTSLEITNAESGAGPSKIRVTYIYICTYIYIWIYIVQKVDTSSFAWSLGYIKIGTTSSSEHINNEFVQFPRRGGILKKYKSAKTRSRESIFPG